MRPGGIKYIVFCFAIAVSNSLQSQNFLPIKQGKLWGFIDSLGTVVIEPKYQHVGEFYENTCNVCEGFYCGLIYKDGSIKVPIKFESVRPLGDSLYIVKSLDEKYGVYKNEEEEIVYFSSIIQVQESKEELLINDTDLKISYLYKNGKLIEIPKCKELTKFQEFYIVSSEDSKNYLIDSAGNRYGEFDFESINSPFENAFLLKKNGKQALYYNKEKLLGYNFEGIKVYNLSGKLFEITASTYVGLYNFEEQRFIFLPKYLSIEERLIDGNQLYVLTDKDAKTTILNEGLDTIAHDVSSNFKLLSSSVVCFGSTDNWQISSKKYGTLSHQFKQVSLENEGFFLVTKKEGVGLINRYGKLVLEPKYKEFFRSGLMIRAVKQNNDTELFEIDSRLNLIAKDTYKKFETLTIGGEDGVDFSRFNFAKDTVNYGSGTVANNNPIIQKSRYTTSFQGSIKALYDNQRKKNLTGFLFSEVATEELNSGGNGARVLFQSGRMGIVNAMGKIYANNTFILDPKSAKTTVKPFCYISNFDESGRARFSVNMRINKNPKLNRWFFDEPYYNTIANGGQWGLLNDKGEILIQPTFRYIQEITEDYIIGSGISGGTGVLSMTGDTILPFIYSAIETHQIDSKTYYTVYKAHGYWSLFDVDGNVINQKQYNNVGYENEGVLGVKIGNKWTAVTKEGRQISEPIFTHIGKCEGGIIVAKKGQRWGAIDIQGETKIEFKFQLIGNYSHGVLPAKEKSLYGLIDVNGQWVKEPIYKKIYTNNNGYLIAKKNKLLGVIDSLGNWKIKPKYRKMYALNSEFYKVKSPFSDKYKILDINGKPINNKAFPSIFLLTDDGWFSAKNTKKKYALLNRKGERVVEFGEFFQFSYIGDSLFKARKGSLWYVIDTKGTLLFEGKGFGKIGNSANGLIVLFNDKQKKWELVKIVSGDVISSSLQQIPIEKGFIPVTSNGLEFLDENGRMLFKKSNASYVKSNTNTIVVSKTFYDGNATITGNKNYALINKFGLQLSDFVYGGYKIFEGSFTALRTSVHIGVFDADFNELIPPSYENVDFFGGGLVKVGRASSIGYFDLNKVSWIWNIN